MPRIFDAFFSTKPRGMGMGLAISRSIVEAHGGSLSVSSIPGKQTVFEIRLPTQLESFA
jgi:signal transduction histidine kinase